MDSFFSRIFFSIWLGIGVVVFFADLLERANTTSVIANFALVTCSMLVALALARFIEQPVTRLRLASRKVAEGESAVRLLDCVRSTSDNLAMLAREFDLLADSREQLRDNQQRLMRDVSHELRSPLSRLQALFSLCRQRMDTPDGGIDHGDLDRMEAEAERLNALIERLLTFTRLSAMTGVVHHDTDIVDLLSVIVDDAGVEGAPQGKDVVLSGLPKSVIKVDSGLLQSAFENIIRNALRYTAPDTNVEVVVETQRGNIVVRVLDNGPGAPEPLLGRLFEPFFRVEEGRGHKTGGGGIGLAIARRAIALHGGTIAASNRPEGGLIVTIEIPVLS